MDTNADFSLEKAKELVQGSIEQLANVVVLQCHGSSDFNSTYQAKMRESLNKLMEVRELLD